MKQTRKQNKTSRSKFSYQSKKRAARRTIFCTSQESVSQRSAHVPSAQHCVYPFFWIGLFWSMHSLLARTCKGKIGALLSGKLLLLCRRRTGGDCNMICRSIVLQKTNCPQLASTTACFCLWSQVVVERCNALVEIDQTTPRG